MSRTYKRRGNKGWVSPDGRKYGLLRNMNGYHNSRKQQSAAEFDDDDEMPRFRKKSIHAEPYDDRMAEGWLKNNRSWR